MIAEWNILDHLVVTVLKDKKSIYPLLYVLQYMCTQAFKDNLGLKK